jgi:hypothetical protein
VQWRQSVLAAGIQVAAQRVNIVVEIKVRTLPSHGKDVNWQTTESLGYTLVGSFVEEVADESTRILSAHLFENSLTVIILGVHVSPTIQ